MRATLPYSELSSSPPSSPTLLAPLPQSYPLWRPATHPTEHTNYPALPQYPRLQHPSPNSPRAHQSPPPHGSALTHPLPSTSYLIATSCATPTPTGQSLIRQTTSTTSNYDQPICVTDSSWLYSLPHFPTPPPKTPAPPLPSHHPPSSFLSQNQSYPSTTPPLPLPSPPTLPSPCTPATLPSPSTTR